MVEEEEMGDRAVRYVKCELLQKRQTKRASAEFLRTRYQ